MSERLIADNWSLQNVAELLTEGINAETVPVLEIDRAADYHAYKPMPQALVSFEALFDLLTDIVLRDQILVDQAFISSWIEDDAGLQQLVHHAVVRPYEFLAQADKLAGPRDEFVERLCLTGSMRAAHEENVTQWALTRQTPDSALSAILWGGAGMLARAFVTEQSYTPHPVRRRLFQQAGIVLGEEDAVGRLRSIVHQKRVSLSQSRSGPDTLYAMRLNLPPLPLLIIREATTPSQLLTIALQLRSEYQALRDWLGEYQQSLSGGDPANRWRIEKILRSISTYIDSVAGRTDSNAPTFTAGFSALKIAFKGQPLEYVRNQYGVRATVNRLILSGSGHAELKKLLGFFDHRNTDIAIRVIQHFSMTKT